MRLQLPSALILALLVLALGLNQNQMIPVSAQGSGPITVVHDYKHDVSPPVRSIQPLPVPPSPKHEKTTPLQIHGQHQDQLDPVVQNFLAPAAMPGTLLNF